jgi:FolB domain-containing protein
MSRDHIFIQDLLARGVIGVNAWERETVQDIVVNLVLHTDLRHAGATDDVADSIDYRLVSHSVISHIESSSYRTLEALATEIARICIGHGAQSVRVRVEKPGAVRFTRSVGVEIVRSRSDLQE